MNSKYYRVADVAEHLGVDKKTVYRWIRTNVIPPPSRLGGKIYRWPVSTIDNWIESQTGNSNGLETSNIELSKDGSAYVETSSGEPCYEREHGDQYGQSYESSVIESRQDCRRIV